MSQTPRIQVPAPETGITVGSLRRIRDHIRDLFLDLLRMEGSYQDLTARLTAPQAKEEGEEQDVVLPRFLGVHSQCLIRVPGSVCQRRYISYMSVTVLEPHDQV